MLSYFLNLPIPQQILFTYLTVVNIFTFFFYGFDKMRSQVENARRVSEKALWLFALIGGSLGALLSMHLFRHKTKKLSFQAGFAIILALQALAVSWLLTK